MRILTIDIGTGTQDILLFDSRLDIENGYKLVMPSPTLLVSKRIHEATRRRQPLLLSGVTMGGGPCAWAAEAHLRAGLPVYATPEAARSFDDDLDTVKRMGITVLGEDEARSLPATVRRMEMRDLDLDPIRKAFSEFGVRMDSLSAVAVAVFDHGNAPPGISDRKFRFDYLDERIHGNGCLSAFAYLAQDIPPIMTRMAAVNRSAQGIDCLLVVMDTAPAAVLGATFDPLVSHRERLLVANIGNFHTLAFRLSGGSIDGVFEHHTGLLDRPRLERYLGELAGGSITREEVYNDHGHGALVYGGGKLDLDEGEFGVAVTGPRRRMMEGSALRPYFCAPFGDMMLSGNIGLISAVGDLLPNARDEIRAALKSAGETPRPPWETDA